MTLDVDTVARQLASVRDTIVERARFRHSANYQAYLHLQKNDTIAIQKKIDSAGPKLRLRVPGMVDRLDGRVSAPAAPDAYQAICADSSLIPPDRHSPLRSYLINVGWVRLRYGGAPECEIAADSRLHVDDREMGEIDETDRVTVHQFDTQRLDVEKSINEFEMLANLISTIPFDMPTLILIDGPLSIYGLANLRNQGRAWKNILKRYDDVMDFIREHSAYRPVALVGYVSFPGTELVANLLRVAACPHPVADCSKHCSRSTATKDRDCDSAGSIDRFLFESLLRPGDRSSVFRLPRDESDGATPLSFCYLKTQEIARLEMPDWVVNEPDRLNLAHALVVDQIQRGQGYPVAAIEADQRARLDTTDRLQYERLIADLLAEAGLPEAGSAKSASKRRRGL